MDNDRLGPKDNVNEDVLLKKRERCVIWFERKVLQRRATQTRTIMTG